MSCLQLKLLEMVARGTAGTRYPLYPVRTGVGLIVAGQALWRQKLGLATSFSPSPPNATTMPNPAQIKPARPGQIRNPFGEIDFRRQEDSN
jgi:hypothetical protein